MQLKKGKKTKFIMLINCFLKMIKIGKCSQKFDKIVVGYNGDYVCEEFDSYDVRGNELW